MTQTDIDLDAFFQAATGDIQVTPDDTEQEDGFDLGALLTQIKPNILTPHLAELSNTKNEKKPRTVAQLLVKHMHQTLEKPVAKQIAHKGEIHTIRYFDIEPLMKGVWSEMSLILLNLSYAEQCDIIDALYPEDVKLTAKAFSINFTRDTVQHREIEIRDNDVSDKLDATNVGIAMILATLTTMGGSLAVHPDLIARFASTMTTVADEAKKRDQYAANMTRSENANKYQDRLSR
jgi:hypothetical protein